MTDNKSNQEKDKEMFEAYAGVAVMFAFIIIIFALTTPGFLGGDSSDADTIEIVQAGDEATEEAVVVVNEATEGAVVVDEATEEVADEATAYDPELVAQGATLFVTCSACHGPDAMGIPGLGKDLVNGEFVNTATDEELTVVITSGRPVWDAENTTMVDMPPKGGNPMLTDDDVVAIVAYLRSLSPDADTGAENSEVASEESASSDETTTAYDADSIANGETLFITCSACHGPDAMGIPGLGKDLVNGEFVNTATDEELTVVITSGRPIWDAENTTMVDMPARGGNPTLTEEDIYDIVAYIRSLQSP